MKFNEPKNLASPQVENQEQELGMTAQEIVERIMSHHWDMVRCECWICHEGRLLGFGPRDKYLEHKSATVVGHVKAPRPAVEKDHKP